MVQKYGIVIAEERIRNGMPRDVLANILLLSDEAMEAVENGQLELNECRLNICANIFNLSKEALVLGVRLSALSDDDITLQIMELKMQIDALARNIGTQPSSVLEQDDMQEEMSPQL